MPLVFSTSSVGTLWVYSCLGRFLWGGFLDQSVLLVDHLFGYLSFLNAFIHFSSKSVMNGGEFLNPNPCMPKVFQLDIFLSVALSASGCMFTCWPSSSIHNSVSMLFIHSCFFMIFPFSYSAPKSFCHSVVGITSPILPFLAGRIFFDVLERPVLSILFGSVSVSF